VHYAALGVKRISSFLFALFISCPPVSYIFMRGEIGMYRYRRLIHVAVFIMLILLTFNFRDNPFIFDEADTVSQPILKVKDKETDLYKRIIQAKSSYEIEPQDAYIDRVWKKTPGRNGLQVNVEKSYENMKDEQTFNKSLLVFEEVKPGKSLKDLPASPIFRGHPNKDMVGFFINVSWGTEYIPDILNTLKQHKVKATFFIEGRWAKENANLVKMIDEQGHVIGNHAYDHPDMAQLSEADNRKQITQTNDIIKAIVDKTPQWFAPPSGSYNDAVVRIADDLDMETVLWTVDTIDWQNPSVSVMVKHVLDKVHPGATVLMHPTLSVANGLDTLITNLEDLGYQIGTIERLFHEGR